MQAKSINNIRIRLTDERWNHIIRNKPYLEPYYDQILETITSPTWVLQGYAGAQVAVLRLRKDQNLHVVYKEVSDSDGFVITAYVSRKVNRSQIIWPKRS